MSTIQSHIHTWPTAAPGRANDPHARRRRVAPAAAAGVQQLPFAARASVHYRGSLVGPIAGAVIGTLLLGLPGTILGALIGAALT